jgi:KaiC/GvpD/RAD55 family RecA-like ATPase
VPLLSASRKATTLAPPLPVVNAVFASAGLVFRRGQFSLVAAAPGVGKTLFATNLTVKTPVPSLYFSADSDEWTVKQRACSILSGVTLGEVEQHLNDEAWESFYAEKLRAADHVDWCFQTDIDTEFIVQRLFAHTELRGEYPQLVIVDNLGNTVVDQDNEGSELRATCRELQRIARTTDAHVMGLCHVKGPKENGAQAITLGDLLYNIGKIPELVLGLHRDQGGLVVTVPKYRGGKHGMNLPVPLDYTRATLGGFK